MPRGWTAAPTGPSHLAGGLMVAPDRTSWAELRRELVGRRVAFS